MVNADQQFKADVLVRDGLIASVGPDLVSASKHVGYQFLTVAVL